MCPSGPHCKPEGSWPSCGVPADARRKVGRAARAGHANAADKAAKKEDTGKNQGQESESFRDLGRHSEISGSRHQTCERRHEQNQFHPRHSH
jgi:hypothetical protein